jgi:hypothetical protein
MTDGPRFSTAPPNPDDAHLRYFGGGLVSFVFALVDMWRSRKFPPAPRARRAPVPGQSVDNNRARALRHCHVMV